MNTITKIRQLQPLVHSITNYVTSNDVANIILAIGAKALMAESKEEMTEITAISKALNLNMGMLSSEKLEAMLIAGKTANKHHIPIVLDPVGCGASQFRRDALSKLLNEITFTVIKGNASEMLTLYKESHITIGVDATTQDLQQISKHLDFYQSLANNLHTILVITGVDDYVISKDAIYKISNGHPMMASVSGTGCSLNGLIGAFIAVDDSIESVVEAVIAMGLAGEKAYQNLNDNEGNASYRTRIIDQIYLMNDDKVKEGAKYVRL